MSIPCIQCTTPSNPVQTVQPRPARQKHHKQTEAQLNLPIFTSIKHKNSKPPICLDCGREHPETQHHSSLHLYRTQPRQQPISHTLWPNQYSHPSTKITCTSLTSTKTTCHFTATLPSPHHSQQASQIKIPQENLEIHSPRKPNIPQIFETYKPKFSKFTNPQTEILYCQICTPTN